MNPDRLIRPARTGDAPGAYYVCLKTGDYGKDGEPFYREDPDALGRIFVGPYLVFEPELSLVLEDNQGICGYALGAFDSHQFFARYEAEWRRELCANHPRPTGDPIRWTRSEQIHALNPTRPTLHISILTCSLGPKVKGLEGKCWNRSSTNSGSAVPRERIWASACRIKLPLGSINDWALVN